MEPFSTIRTPRTERNRTWMERLEKETKTTKNYTARKPLAAFGNLKKINHLLWLQKLITQFPVDCAQLNDRAPLTWEDHCLTK